MNRHRRYAQMELSEALKKKVLSIKAEGGSAKTIAWYEANVNLFILHMTEHRVEPVVHNLTIDQVESWFVSQKEKGLSPNTLENRCRCLKAFANWLYQREYTKVNQLAKLKKPKVVKEDFDIVELREIQKLLNSLIAHSIIGLLSPFAPMACPRRLPSIPYSTPAQHSRLRAPFM